MNVDPAELRKFGDLAARWWDQETLSQPNWTPIQLAVLQAKLGVMKALGGTLGRDVIAKVNDAASPTGLAKGTVTASSLSLAGPLTIKGQVQQVDLSKISAATSRTARSAEISPTESNPARQPSPR